VKKCELPSCHNMFTPHRGGMPQKFCTPKCARKHWNARRCHCMSIKDDNGKCPYECSPYAAPEHLAKIDASIRQQEEHRRREEHWMITPEERQRMDAAVARFDPDFKRARRQARKAANRRYRVGKAS